MKYFFLLISPLLFITCSNSANSPGSEQPSTGKKDHTDSRITETVRYNQNGQPFLKIRYDYNDEGLLKREVFWDSSYSGVRTREKVYFFEDSLKSRMEFRTDQGIEYTASFEHDNDGNLTREEYTDTALMSWTTYKYNERGKETERVSWKGPGQYQKYTYSYNDVHMLDTIKSLDKSGNVLRTDVLHYEEDTVKTQMVMYDAEGNVMANWEYEYNDEGQLVEEVEIDSNGNQYVLKKYTYNDRGNVIQEESFKYRFYTRRFDYDSAGYLVRERYFDQMGNLNYLTTYEPKP